MEDIELWHKVTQGDTSALEKVYKRHFRLLFNYGLHICNNEELIKDVIHDLFLKIFDNRNISHDVSVVAYLLSALRNNLIEQMYALNINSSIDETDIFELTDLDPNLEALFYLDDGKLQVYNEVKSAFSKLTNNQQQVLYLRYVHEMKYGDIASFLNINIQSAMNLATRAMTKIREVLKVENS